MSNELGIHCNNTEITFILKRSNRKSIAVKVYPDQHVEVTAPWFSSKRLILKTINSKSEWILKKQREFACRPQPLPEPEYETGEIFSFLGNPLILEVSEGVSGVSAGAGAIRITVPSGSTREKRKKLLLEYYRKESKKIFAERINECVIRTKSIGITEIPDWNCKKMKRRWGSCTSDNRIHLNIELIAAPLELIDYVIIHELCHLIEHNHSPRYYSLLSRVCPEWKILRKELNEKVQIRLI